MKLIGRERASQFVAAQARWLVFSGQFQDTLETDNATAIRACNHGGHTGLRNQIGIYLYDDFDFYRGLLGDLVAWSAVSRQENRRTPNAGTGPYRTLELSNAGSSMVRWALDIGPDARWLESKVQRTDHPGDFRFKAWNRMPKAQPTLKVAPSEVGLAGAEDVLQVQLLGPAFREPTEVDVRRIGGTLRLKVNRPVKLQVNLHALLSDRPQDARLSLQMKRSDGSWQPVSDGVTWESGRVAFPAVAGEFELRQAER